MTPTEGKRLKNIHKSLRNAKVVCKASLLYIVSLQNSVQVSGGAVICVHWVFAQATQFLNDSGLVHEQGSMPSMCIHEAKGLIQRVFHACELDSGSPGSVHGNQLLGKEPPIALYIQRQIAGSTSEIILLRPLFVLVVEAPICASSQQQKKCAKHSR